MKKISIKPIILGIAFLILLIISQSCGPGKTQYNPVLLSPTYDGYILCNMSEGYYATAILSDTSNPSKTIKIYATDLDRETYNIGDVIGTKPYEPIAPDTTNNSGYSYIRIKKSNNVTIQ